MAMLCRLSSAPGASDSRASPCTDLVSKFSLIKAFESAPLCYPLPCKDCPVEGRGETFQSVGSGKGLLQFFF